MATSSYKLLCLFCFLCILACRSSGTFVGNSHSGTSSLLETHTKIIGEIAGTSMEQSVLGELKSEEQQIFYSSHRKLVGDIKKSFSTTKTTTHDVIDPPATSFPATPITSPETTPATFPYMNPTPTTVIIPPSNPVILTPTNPVNTPVTILPTTPITVPTINPSNPPITVPTATPVTNPVTTYPFLPPPTNPAMTPVTTGPNTNPVTPSPISNSPMGLGQTWCVAKTGALESALQSALDYACGTGGVDCSAIQETGSCNNPNSLENHASYAFNNYYQRNPVPSSCDFGGTATIVSNNPSTSSCLYPSYSSSSTTVASSSMPSVFNTSSPASSTANILGSEPQFSVANLRLVFPSIVLVASFLTGRLVTSM